MNKKILLLPGDGIGPEIINEAKKILNKIEEKFNHNFEFTEALIGGAAFDETNTHLPGKTIQMSKEADAVLLGAVGGPVDAQEDPKWKDAEKNSLLGLRQELQLNINLRPAKLYSGLTELSPLKDEIIKDGVDIMIVRELIGGIYFGEHKNLGDSAEDIMSYSKELIRIPVEFAFRAAMLRKKKLTLIDKANVLECSRLWRRVTEEISKDYKEVELEYMFIDNATQQLIKNPNRFDVIVTGNMFGDIISDEASVLPGSLGLMPSASIGQKYAMYEPIHGSAPKHAGKNTINPIATILSAAMMLRYSFNLEKEAIAIEKAVENVINLGVRTKDIATNNKAPVGTAEMGNAIAKQI